MHKSHLTLFLSAVLALAPALEGNTCTNVIVTKGASKDGSTLVTYAADSHALYAHFTANSISIPPRSGSPVPSFGSPTGIPENTWAISTR